MVEISTRVEERRWIDLVLSIINKENFGIDRTGGVERNELDIVLSSIQVNPDIIDISLEMKNFLSMLANNIEKITLLAKEINRILNSIDLSKTIVVITNNNEKLYLYNTRLETYISLEDYNKIEELYRRCVDIFKQLVRKYCYLIIASKQIETKPPEEKTTQQYQPSTSIQYQPSYNYQTFQQPEQKI